MKRERETTGPNEKRDRQEDKTEWNEMKRDRDR